MFQSSADQNHKVKIAIGNGLRVDIWREFQDRFNIEVIGEFYGATEGNGGSSNISNKIGSVGRFSPVFVSPNLLCYSQRKINCNKVSYFPPLYLCQWPNFIQINEKMWDRAIHHVSYAIIMENITHGHMWSNLLPP